jgi:hypothetical protein
MYRSCWWSRVSLDGKTKKKEASSSYDRVNTTNGVSPPAGNRLPPFVMSQQTTCKELSLSAATWLQRFRQQWIKAVHYVKITLSLLLKKLIRCGILSWACMYVGIHICQFCFKVIATFFKNSKL